MSGGHRSWLLYELLLLSRNLGNQVSRSDAEMLSVLCGVLGLASYKKVSASYSLKTIEIIDDFGRASSWYDRWARAMHRGIP